MTEVTRILNQIKNGDPSLSDQLLPLVYDELRALAAHRLANEKPGQTLQATALVHEAYIRLVGNDDAKHWDSRRHFFSAAAEAMRRILVENARRRNRKKHGGDFQRAELFDNDLAVNIPADEIVAVDDALEKLGSEDQMAAEILKLRYFAGMSLDEIADALGISRATAYRHWTYARAWIRREVFENEPDLEK